jgi:hypothetical protein
MRSSDYVGLAPQRILVCQGAKNASMEHLFFLVASATQKSSMLLGNARLFDESELSFAVKRVLLVVKDKAGKFY